MTAPAPAAPPAAPVAPPARAGGGPVTGESPVLCGLAADPRLP